MLLFMFYCLENYNDRYQRKIVNMPILIEIMVAICVEELCYNWTSNPVEVRRVTNRFSVRCKRRQDLKQDNFISGLEGWELRRF